METWCSIFLSIFSLSVSWMDYKSSYQDLASSDFQWKSQCIHQVLSAWGNRMRALSTDANTSWNVCLPFPIFFSTGSLHCLLCSSGTVSSFGTRYVQFRSFFSHALNPQLPYHTKLCALMLPGSKLKLPIYSLIIPHLMVWAGPPRQIHEYRILNTIDFQE